jgi:RHS repeat-associated protein
MREGTCDSYRYQYQGETAEKDKETGWNHFELREYDPVTGRWLSTDPYGEFWSSYVGMAGDPVNNIDPDGGFTDPGYANSGRSAQPPKSTNVAPPKPPSFFSADYWKIGEGKTPEFVKDFVQLFPPTAMVVSGHTMAKGQNPITQENVSGFSRYVGVLDFIPEGGTAAKAAFTPFVLLMRSKIAARGFKAFSRIGINNIDDFMASATALTGNRDGLTEVGRALQKHINRVEGQAFKNLRWSHKTGNNDGVKVLEEILNSKNRLVKPALQGGYIIYDKATKRGFAVSRNGFRTFAFTVKVPE